MYGESLSKLVELMVCCVQATDEEKLQIAQHYLLSSPPGQFNEVLTGMIENDILMTFLSFACRCSQDCI